MRNRLVLSVLSLACMTSTAQAALSLKCEGWFQANGGQLQRKVMAVEEQTNLNWKQSVTVEGYTFKVNWDVNLDSFYSEIYHGDQRILFTTARVPTFPHNDSFTDLQIPSGPRLAISCNFVQ